MSLFPSGHKSGLFVHAGLDAVAGSILSWGNEIGRHTQGEKRSIPFAEAWQFVDESRIFTPNRAIIAPISGAWTAFFDNHSREFLATAKLFVLCKRLNVDTCFFSYDHSTATEHCGSAQFVYCRPSDIGGLAVTREVMLLKESGWKFTLSGESLPFEDMAAYQRPKKKERLTPELLRQYGRAIGIPFWDSAAYGDTVYQLQWGSGKHDTDSTLKKIIAVLGKPKAFFRGGQQ